MIDIDICGDTIKGIELFVFDKDGTIIDLYNYWHNMVAMRADLICEASGLKKDEHSAGLMYAMGDDVNKGMLRPAGPVGLFPRSVVQLAAENYISGLGIDQASKICFEAFKRVDEISMSRLDVLVKPFPGAISLLRAIKARGGFVAIATTDKTQRAQVAMDFLGVTNSIDIVVGADQVKNSKPDPEMLLLICEKLGIHPEHAVMVGDANTDVMMGVNAGYLASIGLSCGLAPESELKEITPYVVGDISKIIIKSA